MRKADWCLRRRSRPDMSMSDYLDAQAKYDRAADQDDIFEICRAIVGGQKPFSAMEKSHVSVSRPGEWITQSSTIQDKTTAP